MRSLGQEALLNLVEKRHRIWKERVVKLWYSKCMKERRWKGDSEEDQGSTYSNDHILFDFECRMLVLETHILLHLCTCT